MWFPNKWIPEKSIKHRQIFNVIVLEETSLAWSKRDRLSTKCKEVLNPSTTMNEKLRKYFEKATQVTREQPPALLNPKGRMLKSSEPEAQRFQLSSQALILSPHQWTGIVCPTGFFHGDSTLWGLFMGVSCSPYLERKVYCSYSTPVSPLHAEHMEK